MKFKVLLLTLVIMGFASQSMAYQVDELPSGDKKRNQQIQRAMEVLEDQLGQPLNQEQEDFIIQASVDDSANNYVEVASVEEMRTPKKKSIYCVGGTISATVKRSGAVCVHIWSLTPYSFQVIGGGVSFELEVNAFRATVTYDSSRYDESFDPLYGVYGGIAMGATFGIGMDVSAADSGNKTLEIKGFNQGIGLDVLSINMIVIQ